MIFIIQVTGISVISEWRVTTCHVENIDTPTNTLHIWFSNVRARSSVSSITLRRSAVWKWYRWMCSSRSAFDWTFRLRGARGVHLCRPEIFLLHETLWEVTIWRRGCGPQYPWRRICCLIQIVFLWLVILCFSSKWCSISSLSTE